MDGGRKLSLSEGDGKQSSKFRFDIKTEGRVEADLDGPMGEGGDGGVRGDNRARRQMERARISVQKGRRVPGVFCA